MAGTISLVNFSNKAADGAFSKMKAADAPSSNFLIVDHNDGFSFQSLDANSLPIQLADLISVVSVSSDPTVVSVVRQQLGRVLLALLKPGAATLTMTVTYKNGGAGPFTVTVPLTVFGLKGSDLRYGMGTISIA